MLHMTHDIWHMTLDMWHGGRWKFSHNVSSLAHTVWEWRFFEDLEEKDESLNELMSDKGVCRTAPATPDLVIRANFKRVKFQFSIYCWKTPSYPATKLIFSIYINVAQILPPPLDFKWSEIGTLV